MAGLEFEAQLVGPQNPRLGELLSLGWSGPCVSALEFTGERHQDVCSSESPWREKQAPSPSTAARASLPGSGRTGSPKLQLYF